MSDYQAVDGGESRRDRIRYRMEDEFLEATEGDDFVGVQTYSRDRIGPDGMLGPRGRRRDAAHGLRVLAGRRSRRRSAGRGR